jgi:hypothetical protein
MTDPFLDLRKILELAKAALATRDDQALWKRDFDAAAEAHSEACNALWEELEEQVARHLGPSA